MSTIDAEAAAGRSGLRRDDAQRRTALARLVVGFVQGLALYWLFRSAGGASDGANETWPYTQPLAFGPLLLVAAYLPIVVLAGIGRLRLRTLLIWTGVLALTLAGLALHDIARQGAERDDLVLTPGLFAFAAAALFIAHHLIVPADRQRRLIADYHGYFDAAWMAGVQLALSISFTGAFWLLLFLGSALFKVIGLTFLGDLITESWFAFPVTGVVFATAVQLTDVRDGLIRGVRTVALMLLSWLLLVLTVLVAGFLAALPFTGLEGLWKTGSATALVLSAAGALIILINTAYQDGREDNLPPAVLRIAVRVASVLLTPLIVIAVWGLMLRIGQHGLTPDRIIASACALIGALYAAGYGLGALVPFVRRGSPWMKALEPTNVAAAVLEVCVILALFSPLADPARMSVKDQMGRLERGAVSPADFDYAFLRFDSGKVGEQALERLSQSKDPVIAANVAKVKAATSRYDVGAQDNLQRMRPAISAWPADAALPADFGSEAIYKDARKDCDAADPCVAVLRDLNGDGQVEVLLAQRYTITLFAREDGLWAPQGEYQDERCPGESVVNDARERLKTDAIRPMTQRWPDLDLGNRNAMRLRSEARCEDARPTP